MEFNIDALQAEDFADSLSHLALPDETVTALADVRIHTTTSYTY